MAYWLLKSEPDVFSWDDLVACGAAGECAYVHLPDLSVRPLMQNSTNSAHVCVS